MAGRIQIADEILEVESGQLIVGHVVCPEENRVVDAQARHPPLEWVYHLMGDLIGSGALQSLKEFVGRIAELIGISNQRGGIGVVCCWVRGSVEISNAGVDQPLNDVEPALRPLVVTRKRLGAELGYLSR